ncbi:MAG: hypothetical protein M1831_005433 [Alyxoria varia]|nr:MAG: hypothetical protein M1831_005433 [Alyxoria varia]
MTSNQNLRVNPTVWYLRLGQAVLTAAILFITLCNAHEWHKVDCGVPRQLQINIACALITSPFLLYLLPATGRRVSIIPWSSVFQILIDVALVLLWAVPSSLFVPFDTPTAFFSPTTYYTCTSVCDSCRPDHKTVLAEKTSEFFVWAGNHLTCSCYVPGKDESDPMRKLAVQIIRTAKLRPGKGIESTKVLKGAEALAAKKATNYTMVFLVLMTLLLTIFSVVRQARRSDRLATRDISPTSPPHGGFDMKKHTIDTTSIKSVASSEASSPSTPRSGYKSPSIRKEARFSTPSTPRG